MNIVDIIKQDFTIVDKPGKRWLTTVEHDSLVIDTHRNLFWWNSRNIFGNSFDYLVKVKGLPASKAMLVVKDVKSSKKFEIETSPFIAKINTQNVDTNPLLAKLFWENGKNTRDYWYRRCLTDTTIDEYLLGFYNDWYTLPVFNKGALLNIQLRKDKPEKMIRLYYKNKELSLLNESILSFENTVYFTEGIVDAILLTQNGFPAVARLGGANAWNNKWFASFATQKQIKYIADNDLVGISSAKKLANALGETRVTIFIFSEKSKGYDTVDFFRDGGTAEEFKWLVDTRSKFVFQL